MPNRAFVVGVGMTPFVRPGTRDWDYPDMAREAGSGALADAGITYDHVQQVFVGYCYGDSTAGQRAVYELGRSGVPVVNVNNNCSTGSTALYLARQWVLGGLADCVLALGFEKMEQGSLGIKYEDRAFPIDRHIEAMARRHELTGAPMAAQMFGNAGRDHMARYGSAPEHFAWIGWKNHQHSANNPNAQFQTPFELSEIAQSRVIHDPLTLLQCSPTSDGSAAAVIASERFVEEHDLWAHAVEIAGQGLATDRDTSYPDDGDAIRVVGFDLSRSAAATAYEQAQLDASDAQVIELHDCFSTNELITYEALGLAPEGEGHLLVERRDTTYGGRWVVNPSGGLISKGHPLGATGLAQCAELSWQIRGEAGPRQVDDVRVGIQHNIGLGGAAVVTVYRRPE